jgi:hypothetical protein
VIDQRLTKTLAAALAAATFMGAAITAAPAMAQPRAYGSPEYGQNYGPGYGNQGGRYYYNGQWVDQNNWEQSRQREFQRNRRARDYNNRNGNDTAAAAIIGFALGAAILGNQNDARQSYGYAQDRNHQRSCATRYRGYDPRSNTYLGRDGYRRYCMG